jgi:hypothetical protein
MDIFLIKKVIDFPKIYHDYFFTCTTQKNYETKYEYFIHNKIIDKKYISNFFYVIPFKIIGRIVQSMSSENSTHIIGNIHINSILWKEKYFNSNVVDNFDKKKEMYIILNNEINIFISCFLKQRKVTKQSIDNLTIVLNEDNYLIKDISDGVHLAMISMNENDTFNCFNNGIYYPESNQKMKSYIDILSEFLKNSIKLYNTLGTTDISNYDCYEDSFESDEKNYILNKRVQITKFYSNAVLKFVIMDIMKAISYFFKII